MDKIALEFTTTSCNRPSLLNATYASYSKNLKGVDFSKSIVYVNIDPAPNSKNIQMVEEVAKRYFGTVVVNYPSSPNFAAAALWCFSQVKGEMFFHLEDDWQLMKTIDIHSMISKLGTSNLQCILNKKKNSIATREVGEPCFVPSLIATQYWKKYLTNFKLDINPEYQMKVLFRNKSTRLFKNHSIYYNPTQEISRDIGRAWLSANKLARSYKPGTRWSPWIKWKNKK